ncbi:Hypothetical protein KLENKIAIHU_4059, partial [Klenkia terrae]
VPKQEVTPADVATGRRTGEPGAGDRLGARVRPRPDHHRRGRPGRLATPPGQPRRPGPGPGARRGQRLVPGRRAGAGARPAGRPGRGLPGDLPGRGRHRRRLPRAEPGPGRPRVAAASLAGGPGGRRAAADGGVQQPAGDHRPGLRPHRPHRARRRGADDRRTAVRRALRLQLRVHRTRPAPARADRPAGSAGRPPAGRRPAGLRAPADRGQPRPHRGHAGHRRGGPDAAVLHRHRPGRRVGDPPPRPAGGRARRPGPGGRDHDRRRAGHRCRRG